jgi:hypothetical protein
MINPLRPTGREEVTFEADDVVFLCEGMDECAVISCLTQGWTKAPKIGTRDNTKKEQGWDKEFRALANQVQMRAIRAIGLVFDAETSRKKRLEELSSWCLGAGLTMPDRECELCKMHLGTVDVSTAYLIAPPSEDVGCLDDLFVPQVRSSALWPCLESLLNCYASTVPSNERRSKLLVRTFIAHRNAYNTGLHLAIRDGHLSCDGPEFQSLRDFVALFA